MKTTFGSFFIGVLRSAMSILLIGITIGSIIVVARWVVGPSLLKSA